MHPYTCVPICTHNNHSFNRNYNSCTYYIISINLEVLMLGNKKKKELKTRPHLISSLQISCKQLNYDLVFVLTKNREYSLRNTPSAD